MSKRAYTIKEVAEDAGLSVKTVSRVLNNEIYVTDETRRVVMESVKKLGYQRNAYARGLRAEKSNFYGLFYANSMAGYHSEVLHGVLAKCKAEDLHLIVELLKDRKLYDQLEDFVAQFRLDGAVLLPPHCDDQKILRIFARHNVPVVRVAPMYNHDTALSVGIDDEKAGYDITRYLLTLGHRRIGFIEGIPDHAATPQRRKGARRALAEFGLDINDELVRSGRFDFDSGLAGTLELMALDIPPTAIVASNDFAAAGVIAAATRLGVAVPAKLSVTGFDDSPISGFVTPAITTVRQPVRELGMEAINIVMEFRKGIKKKASTIRKVLAHDLIERASTAAPEFIAK